MYIHLATRNVFPGRILRSALYGAIVGGIVTILFLKLWQDKETAANGEEGGKRGFKN